MLGMFWPFTRSEKKALTDEDILEMFGSGAMTSAGIMVSAEVALRVPAVSAAVRTIAEAVASLDCRVVEIGNDGTETVAREHPVNALLSDEANEDDSSFEMIRMLVVDALTRDAGGLAWVNKPRNGEPVEIIRYKPGMIGVEYASDGSGRRSYKISGRPVPKDEIIHIRSTFDKCPVTLCREAIGAALIMEQHAASLFANGARPSVVLKSKKGLGDDGVKNMLKGWAKSFAPGTKSGGVGVLYDGTELDQLTLSSVDAQFQQLRIFQLQEIARAFNIPSVLIGELTRATWSNSAEMQRLFLMLTLEPWLLAVEGAFRRALFSGEDRKRYAVRFERDDFSKVDISVLAPAISSLIASRVASPNETRPWLGLPMGPAELDAFVNPHTGASQPATQPAPATPKPDDEEDHDA